MFKQNTWRLSGAAGIVLPLIILLAPRMTKAQGNATTPWEAPEDATKVENPVKATPNGLKQAAQMYQENCVPCHGKTGAGDGPAATSLTPKPANFTDAKLMSKATDGELFWKMSNGRGPMPAWKDQLSDTQRWQLVNYLRTLAGKSTAAK
jgi:mono/diheme cytochrome c family protein